MLLKSSIARKIAMALSALFLMVFLLQHFVINLMSVISPEMFNEVSHFMGTNPLIQFVMQPILMFAVLFHFVMGFVLEIQNNKARPVKYVVNKGSANSSWMSRNMIYSGLFILIFLAIHMIDFWIPEMNYKYIQFSPEDPTRYHHELVEKFVPMWRVALYVLGFVFLALHLLHGFQSAFQSMGARSSKFTPALEKIGKWYAIIVPAGFIFIALFHHFTAH
jgi:succinate dehydrogenase / fumarate reductase cytochrome b subunit